MPGPTPGTRFGPTSLLGVRVPIGLAEGVTTTITSQPRMVVVERSDRRTFAVSRPAPQSSLSG